jgi:hydroxypyruvate isomerase
MLRFSANLSMMFTEHAFLDRFRAAREAGFEAVEFQFPYEHLAEDIGQAIRRHALAVSVFNLPPGNWQAGERGLGCLAARQDEFRASVDAALAYAAATGARQCHVMAGIPGDVTPESARAVFVDNLHHVADRFEEVGLVALIEPLNARDNPGYFLTSTALAVDILKEIDRPNTGLQFDIYHQQIMHGDVVRSLDRHMPLIRHIQIAGVPERHEPDLGELDYAFIFEQLDVLGYEGWVGCEYRPRGGTLQGLGWLFPSVTGAGG